MHLADRIADAFAAPLLIGDGTVAMRASIGVAISAAGLATSENLVAGADTAIYQAKRNRDGRPVAHPG